MREKHSGKVGGGSLDNLVLKSQAEEERQVLEIFEERYEGQLDSLKVD